MEITKFCVINTVALSLIFPMNSDLSVVFGMTFLFSSIYFLNFLKKHLQLDDDIIQ
jgi:hypothetical protein